MEKQSNSIRGWNRPPHQLRFPGSLGSSPKWSSGSSFDVLQRITEIPLRVGIRSLGRISGQPFARKADPLIRAVQIGSLPTLRSPSHRPNVLLNTFKTSQIVSVIPQFKNHTSIQISIVNTILNTIRLKILPNPATWLKINAVVKILPFIFKHSCTFRKHMSTCKYQISK